MTGKKGMYHYPRELKLGGNAALLRGEEDTR